MQRCVTGEWPTWSLFHVLQIWQQSEATCVTSPRKIRELFYSAVAAAASLTPARASSTILCKFCSYNDETCTFPASVLLARKICHQSRTWDVKLSKCSGIIFDEGSHISEGNAKTIDTQNPRNSDMKHAYGAYETREFSRRYHDAQLQHQLFTKRSKLHTVGCRNVAFVERL